MRVLFLHSTIISKASRLHISLTDLLVWLPGKLLGDRKPSVAEANFTFRVSVIAPKVWKYEVQLREDLKIIVGHLKNSRRSG